MKKIFAVVAAAVAFVGFGMNSTYADTKPPAAQTVHGQGPVGYMSQDHGSGILFSQFIVKSTELSQWFGTFGAKCYFVGANRFINPDLNDGIDRWICMQHKEWVGINNVPLGVAKTTFYDYTFDWLSTGSNRFLDCSARACFRLSLNPITHYYAVDAFTVN